MNCDSISNQLKVSKLCAGKVKTEGLCTDKLVAKSACVTALQATTLAVQTETVNNLCAVNANINNLCVQNLTSTNQVNCVKWRADVTLSGNVNYTLGTPIAWNVVLDDPNSNVVLSPFSYTVPVTGYYDLSFYVSSDTLAGAGVLAGTPIGLLTILTNGNILRQFQSAYLSFSGLQTANLGSLVLLNAGDVLTMNYSVLTMDAVNGLVPFTGTVSMKGNGTFPAQSGFAIHYLSSLNCTTPAGATCTPCITVPPIVCDCDNIMEPGQASCRQW
jgi:hypothetical protein